MGFGHSFLKINRILALDSSIDSSNKENFYKKEMSKKFQYANFVCQIYEF